MTEAEERMWVRGFISEMNWKDGMTDEEKESFAWEMLREAQRHGREAAKAAKAVGEEGNHG